MRITNGLTQTPCFSAAEMAMSWNEGRARRSAAVSLRFDSWTGLSGVHGDWAVGSVSWLMVLASGRWPRVGDGAGLLGNALSGNRCRRR